MAGLDFTDPISNGSSAAARVPGPCQCAGLDRITEQRAGAVRLDVVDLAHIDVGVGVGGPPSTAICAAGFGAISPDWTGRPD